MISSQLRGHTLISFFFFLSSFCCLDSQPAAAPVQENRAKLGVHQFELAVVVDAGEEFSDGVAELGKGWWTGRRDRVKVHLIRVLLQKQQSYPNSVGFKGIGGSSVAKFRRNLLNS